MSLVVLEATLLKKLSDMLDNAKIFLEPMRHALSQICQSVMSFGARVRQYFKVTDNEEFFKMVISIHRTYFCVSHSSPNNIVRYDSHLQEF